MRKDLYGKGAAAVEAAHDPMIDLARLIDGPAREARKIYDAQDEIKETGLRRDRQGAFCDRRHEQLSGRDLHAAALLRNGARVRGERQTDPCLHRFRRSLISAPTEHDNQPPFDLPKRWVDKKANLNLSATNFNFVSDADIIGGNSGSPVVNKANEFVGIIFDGNIQSLVLDCTYTDKQARAVSVDSAAIIEALRKVYDAQPLVDELLSAK